MTTTAVAPARVAVCVATYRRPDGLARLLDGLAALTGDALIRVVVIDNDPEGPSRDSCEARAQAFVLGLRYEVESQRGITFARNRSVEMAGDDVDFIAMVDDDQVPSPRWLDALLRVQAAFDADIVSGPVLPYFPTPPATWICDGRFFDRPRYRTGHELTHTHTGNVLVRRSVFERTGRFDDRFALTGGEDLEFFRRATNQGARIIWADDAAVEEWIPPTRANARWLLQRAYRGGNTLGQVDRDRPDVLVARAMRLIRGTGRLTQGLLLAPVAVLVPRALTVRFVRALMLIWRGAGMIAGVLGRRYEEYRKTHSV
jgi:glycosyltransferase involved in cell wall biosynthesis